MITVGEGYETDFCGGAGTGRTGADSGSGDRLSDVFCCFVKGAQALFSVLVFTMIIEQFLTIIVLAWLGTTILFIIELFRAMRRYEYA